MQDGMEWYVMLYKNFAPSFPTCKHQESVYLVSEDGKTLKKAGLSHSLFRPQANQPSLGAAATYYNIVSSLLAPCQLYLVVYL